MHKLSGVLFLKTRAESAQRAQPGVAKSPQSIRKNLQMLSLIFATHPFLPHVSEKKTNTLVSKIHKRHFLTIIFFNCIVKS